MAHALPDPAHGALEEPRDPLHGAEGVERLHELGELERARASRAHLEINTGAIVHNLAVIRQLAGASRVMAVIKGNAYGLGAIPLGRLLQAHGVEAFAVDNVAEGIELRQAGITRPVLIIDGDIADNAALAIKYDLCPGVPNAELLAAFDRQASIAGRRHPIWLVCNVGFNRSGPYELEAVAELARAARACRHLEVRAICAHLSNAQYADGVTERQLLRFNEQVALARRILGPIETSLWASHGLAGFGDRLATDWVRIGILLYGEHGFSPGRLPARAHELVRGLRPALRLRARIIQLMDFPSAQGVGYGQLHQVPAGTRLATVSVGFGGGLPPGAYAHEVLVRGQRARLVGPIGMDALQIEVTGLDDLRLGDWVTLLGSDGAQRIDLASLACGAGRSVYEVLRALNLHRIYTSNGSLRA